MLRDNEEGIALIMVLIMLTVVGVLGAMLLRTARTHTDIAVQEEGRSQAFHSAEAGVEFVRANANDALQKINNNSDGDIIYNEEFEDNINFEVMIEDKDSNTLVSKGIYNSVNEEEYSEKIQFDLLWGEGLRNFNIRRRYENDEEHYFIAGNEKRLRKYISLRDEEGMDFEEYVTDKIGKYTSFEDFDDFQDEAVERSGYDDINWNDDDIIYVDGYLGVGRDISDKIIVIDDYLYLGPQTDINNSIIIVRNYMHGHGNASEWESPLILIYGEDDDVDDYLDLRGGGGLEIDPEGLPEEATIELDTRNWEQQ